MPDSKAKTELLITINLTEEQIKEIQDVSPDLRINNHVTKKGDEISQEVWNKTEILVTDGAWPPDNAEALKFIQFYYAGLDSVLDKANKLPSHVQLASGSGVTSKQVAEYVVAMFLAQAHHLKEVLEWQNKSEWAKNRGELVPTELYDSTVGIIGYGSIGREVARLLQPFRPKILAAKRDVMHPEDRDYIPEGIGDPEGHLFDRLYPIEAVGSMMKECDFLVLAIPLNQYTRGLIKAEHLREMKPTAYLVDISRGGIIEPEALITALEQKWIAGAALDVFVEEPLPSSSPLWKLPNVIISPHISGTSIHYTPRLVELFKENLKRYLNGVPVFNLYKSEKGY